MTTTKVFTSGRSQAVRIPKEYRFDVGEVVINKIGDMVTLTPVSSLATEFDAAKRAELAIEMQQTILDDNAYVFCSFLEMNQISKKSVTGYTAHACDYYQVTADLDINE